MSNGWAGLAAAALLAAAFFLPALLSHWGDQRLLDEPHITRQDEEREGFAESLQLSVAEKLFLLRSGSVTSVALEDMETAEVLGSGGCRRRGPCPTCGTAGTRWNVPPTVRRCTSTGSPR